MSRLTEKRESPLTTKWKDVPTSYYKIKGDDTGVLLSEIERLNKLGQLEDLEELLGFSLTSIDDATDISSLSTSIDATMDNEIYFCADDFYGTYPVEHFQQTIKRILIESIIALKQIKKDKSE